MGCELVENLRVPFEKFGVAHIQPSPTEPLVGGPAEFPIPLAALPSVFPKRAALGRCVNFRTMYSAQAVYFSACATQARTFARQET